MTEQKLDVVIGLLEEILAYQKVQVDIFERIFESRKGSQDRNIEAMIRMLQSNPMFARMGITEDSIRSAFKQTP
jgi:hypothetical protein